MKKYVRIKRKHIMCKFHIVHYSIEQDNNIKKKKIIIIIHYFIIINYRR